MKNIILAIALLTLGTQVFAESTVKEIAYSKASGYTGLKKSLIYQCIGTKRYRRLV